MTIVRAAMIVAALLSLWLVCEASIRAASAAPKAPPPKSVEVAEEETPPLGDELLAEILAETPASSAPTDHRQARPHHHEPGPGDKATHAATHDGAHAQPAPDETEHKPSPGKPSHKGAKKAKSPAAPAGPSKVGLLLLVLTVGMANFALGLSMSYFMALRGGE